MVAASHHTAAEKEPGKVQRLSIPGHRHVSLNMAFYPFGRTFYPNGRMLFQGIDAAGASAYDDDTVKR